MTYSDILLIETFMLCKFLKFDVASAFAQDSKPEAKISGEIFLSRVFFFFHLPYGSCFFEEQMYSVKAEHVSSADVNGFGDR